jgi:predicted nucleotidyltransferase
MRANSSVVAREAARLLYCGIVDEYKSAKLSAAKSLGMNILPSNFDIAMELDRLAEQIEGKEREELILRLRKWALELMTFLSPFQPRLIGSVWRGTARKGSDIDIQVYASSIDEVQKKLGGKFQITKSEWSSKTSEGETSRFYHIFICLQTGDEAEISVKNLADASEIGRDSVYGDSIVGLSTQELQSILCRNSLQKFVPEKKRGRREKR